MVWSGCLEIFNKSASFSTPSLNSLLLTKIAKNISVKKIILVIYSKIRSCWTIFFKNTVFFLMFVLLYYFVIAYNNLNLNYIL